ncbi:MAG: di-heme oxidoredictase family protein [Planctomycetota bacterium]
MVVQMLLSNRIGPRSLAGAACLLAASAYAGTVTPQTPLGDPLAGLTASELTRFETGKTQYMEDFEDFEGLGPIFNQSSCASCHNNPVGGTGTVRVTRAGKWDKGGFDPLEEYGGSLFQQEAISEDCREDVAASGQVNHEIQRVTNGMMGYGLVEAIADDDILANENKMGDPISGVAHMVQSFEDPPNTPRVGRFGWKAQVATILTFTADASLMEIGLTSPFPQTSQENDPNGILPPELVDCDTVSDPEVDMTFLEQVTDFQRFLTQPPQTPKSGMSGEVIFNDIGCADCHIAQFTTADDAGLEDAIRNKVIRPYSDFLLHDMGLNSDDLPQGDAQGREIKTPPLWGLSERDPIWHDGRFEAGTFETRVNDAIMAHDDGTSFAEGRFTAQAYAVLDQSDKDALIAFLQSLGRREFDQDRNNVIDMSDFHAFGEADSFMACFGSVLTDADDPCAIHDIDQNLVIDQDDFDAFMTVYTGPTYDCNANALLDLQEILDGTVTDANTNGIPDVCEDRGDFDGDGLVSTSDLLLLLSMWGQCPDPPAECPADLDGDGFVSTADLLTLLSNWGPF